MLINKPVFIKGLAKKDWINFNPLPVKYSVFSLNQTMVALGLASWTTHLSSTISFSLIFSLEPGWIPEISIFDGGTKKGKGEIV